jgi:prefoldin subunit 5
MLTDISSATLRKMVKLSERKEVLLSQIQELDRQMAALQQSRGERPEVKGRIRSFTRSSGTKRKRYLKERASSTSRAI